MKVALTVWQNRISPVFDVAQSVALLDIQHDRIQNTASATLEGPTPHDRARQVHALGTEVLICGAISRPLTGIFSAYGITTIPFVAGDLETVIAAYLAGQLPSPTLSMPGRGLGMGRGPGGGRRQGMGRGQGRGHGKGQGRRRR